MVLGIATLLVVGIAKLLGGSSDGSSGDDAARTVAVTSSHTAGTVPSGPATYRPSSDTSSHGKHHGKQADDPVTPMAMPSGPCAASDVAITPSVPSPVAGRDISLVLDISSLNTPACTWTLSGRTLALKITSGNDLIWSTSQCAQAVSKATLVVAKGKQSASTVPWDGHRSGPGCLPGQPVAKPGTYVVKADFDDRSSAVQAFQVV